MKKIATLFLAIAVAVSCLSFVSFAADKEAASDGFDFYSMTVHYEQPIITGFVKTTDPIEVKGRDGKPLLDEEGQPVVLKKGGYVWADPTDTLVIPVVKYKDSDGNYNFALQYDETAVKTYNKDIFYSVVSKELGIDSSKLAINKNYGVTDIADHTVIVSRAAVSFFGPTNLYDDAGNPNPNFTKKDGYIVDKNVDENGNNYRIDENGYQVDANGVWFASDGHRVELFAEIGENQFKWIKLADRVDKDGIILPLSEITNEYLVEKKIIEMPAEYVDITDDFDETKDYDGNGTKGDSADKAAHKKLKSDKKSWLKGSCASTYVIDYKDYNGDGKKTTADLEGYKSKDATFTGEDILKKDISGMILYTNGTPKAGEPLASVKIKNITLEIDAMGTQLYTDVASDPMQKNEIIVTFGDVYENVKAALDKVAADSTRYYTEGGIIGSAKCVTTKTEYKADEEDAFPKTLKSVELVLEEGTEIPSNAFVYFNFNVKENQADYKKVYIKKTGNKLATVNRAKLDVEKLPTKEVEESEGKKGCGSVIAGGVSVMSVLALAYVALRKKEN